MAVTASRITYIITPLGDLEGMHWREVEAMPDGASVIVLGLRLRDMAARCGHGGRLERLTNESLTQQDIAAVLGYTLARVQYGMAILSRVGIAAGNDEQGWQIVDPVLQQHYTRLLPALPAPPGSSETPPPLVLEAEAPGESRTERTRRLARNRQTVARYRKRWGVDPMETTDTVTQRDVSVTGSVTQSVTAICHAQPQLSNIVNENSVTDSVTIIEVISKEGINIKAAAEGRHAPEVEAAIRELPAHLWRDAEQIVRDEARSPEITASNILLLGRRKNLTGALLRAAIRNDYAATGRERAAAEAKRQTASEQKRQHETRHALQKSQQLTAKNEKRRAMALAVLEAMAPDSQTMIQAETRRVVGSDQGPSWEWALVDTIERYVACQHGGQQ